MVWTEWQGYKVRVKPRWELTEQVKDYVISSLNRDILELLKEGDRETVDELVITKEIINGNIYTMKRQAVEALLWEWATDFPKAYSRDPIVTQVIDIQKVEPEKLRGSA